MKKFQSNVNRELSRAYPDRRRLETQCLSIISFVKSENDILECPIWIMIINVVAMDMLKSKLPPGKSLSIIMQISKRSLLRNYRSFMGPRNINTILYFSFMIFFCFHSFTIMALKLKNWMIVASSTCFRPQAAMRLKQVICVYLNYLAMRWLPKRYKVILVIRLVLFQITVI